MNACMQFWHRDNFKVMMFVTLFLCPGRCSAQKVNSFFAAEESGMVACLFVLEKCWITIACAFGYNEVLE